MLQTSYIKIYAKYASVGRFYVSFLEKMPNKKYSIFIKLKMFQFASPYICKAYLSYIKYDRNWFWSNI